jgi:hypothetical protein
MPLHARISLPDRPGALATLARLVAGCGADVRSVMVLASEQGRAVDDLLLDWPQGRSTGKLTTALASAPGIRLLGLREVPWGSPTNDLDLTRQLLDQPERAARLLIDALPHALYADWAAMTPTVVTARAPSYSSPGAPLPLPDLRHGPGRPHRASVGACHLLVIPDGGSLVVVGREGDPPFLTSDLDRAAGLVAVARRAAELARGKASATG